ncbi:hypothetical protein ACJJTC_009218 [Scirpophaga incertulas]
MLNEKITQYTSVITKPAPQNDAVATSLQYNYDAQNKPKDEQSDEQIISVRITSSVAVNRGRPRTNQKTSIYRNTPTVTTSLPVFEKIHPTEHTDERKIEKIVTDIPPNLIGANIEFIKQLNAKKELKNQSLYDEKQEIQTNDEHQLGRDTEHLFENIKSVYNYEKHELNYSNNKNIDLDENSENSESVPLGRSVSTLSSAHHTQDKRFYSPVSTTYEDSNNDTVDTIAEPSLKSLHTIHDTDQENDENIENIPLARSVPITPISKNLIITPTRKPPIERGTMPSLTTVSFNIVHDVAEQPNNINNNPSNIYTTPNRVKDNKHMFYEPPKIYSEPAKIYGEPAKIYSEPAKIYSEPAKIYSVPAKIYSEPAKIYSEPAKFYSEPASLHLEHDKIPNTYTPWHSPIQSTSLTAAPWGPSQSSQPLAPITTTVNTTPTTLNTLPNNIFNANKIKEGDHTVVPDTPSEIRNSNIEESTTEKCKDDNCKVGYVVEGKQYKKYRVEERTPDGFIVGEYGVVRNEDGALRGVRYTADSEVSPGLINDALMKFLQL